MLNTPILRQVNQMIFDIIKYNHDTLKDIDLTKFDFKLTCKEPSLSTFFIEITPKKNNDSYALDKIIRVEAEKVDTATIYEKLGYSTSYKKEEFTNEFQNELKQIGELIETNSDDVDIKGFLFTLGEKKSDYLDGYMMNGLTNKEALYLISQGKVLINVSGYDDTDEPQVTKETIDLASILNKINAEKITHKDIFVVSQLKRDNFFYPTDIKFDTAKMAFTKYIERLTAVNPELAKIDFSDFTIHINDNGYFQFRVLSRVDKNKYTNVETARLGFVLEDMETLFSQVGYQHSVPLVRKEMLIDVIPNGLLLVQDKTDEIENTFYIQKDYDLKNFDLDGSDGSKADIFFKNPNNDNNDNLFQIRFRKDDDIICQQKIISGQYVREDAYSRLPIDFVVPKSNKISL